MTRKEKKAREEARQLLKKEAHENFIKTLSLFNGDIEILFNTYKERVLTGHYSHNHYNLLCKLLNYAYTNYYVPGNTITLDILVTKARVSINDRLWLMDSKKGKNYISVITLKSNPYEEVIEHIKLK